MKNFQRKFKWLDLRWREGIGMAYCPYMYRWVLTLGPISFRLHHWLRSDDKRAFHSHPWWFWTFVIKGFYYDVTPQGKEKLSRFSLKFRKAEHNHYVDVPPTGCWTFLVTGPSIHKWGFTLRNGSTLRKDKYFKKYGHPPCSEQ